MQHGERRYAPEGEPRSELRSIHFIPEPLLFSMPTRKLHELRADMVVADLEDSVRPEDKDNSRVRLRAQLRHFRRNISGELCARINPLWTSQGQNDLNFLEGYVTLMVPKVRTASELDHLRGEYIPIFELIDGVKAAEEILANPLAHIRVVVFGKEDLLTDIGQISAGANSENPVPTADLRFNPLLRDYFLQVKRAIEKSEKPIQLIDGITRDIDATSEDLRQEAMFARHLGATGKVSIHPIQIDPINNVFRMSPLPQVEYSDDPASCPLPECPDLERKLRGARRIVEAYENNRNQQNAAVVQIDGQRVIIGPPTYKLCLKLLREAQPG